MHRALLVGALLFGATALAQSEDTDAGAGDGGDECTYDPYTGTTCGSGGGGGGSGAGPYDDEGGCGCGAAPGGAVLGAVMLGAAVRRRRR